MFAYWTFVRFEPAIFICFVHQTPNAFYHKEKVKTKQTVNNDGDGILISLIFRLQKQSAQPIISHVT